MTNDEAMYYLGIIYERSKNGKRPYHTIYQDAFDMAIEALRTQDLPSAQPETHDKRTKTHSCDLISRQAAIDAILAVTGNSSVRELYEHVQEHGLSEMWSGGVNAAIDIIIAVPSAQPDLSEYSDKLWKAAYERGKAEAQDEIVRCKDCKHQVKEWRTDKRLKDKGYMVCGCKVVGDACGYWALLGQDDDFCSCAERRTDVDANT